MSTPLSPHLKLAIELLKEAIKLLTEIHNDSYDDPMRERITSFLNKISEGLVLVGEK